MLSVKNTGLDLIKKWILATPQLRLGNSELLNDSRALASKQFDTAAEFLHHLSRRRDYRILNRHAARLRAAVLYISIDNHHGVLFRNLVVMNEYASAGNLASLDYICYVRCAATDKPYIAIYSAMIGEIERVLAFSGRE